jgi:hypothetical protein
MRNFGTGVVVFVNHSKTLACRSQGLWFDLFFLVGAVNNYKRSATTNVSGIKSRPPVPKVISTGGCYCPNQRDGSFIM